MFRSRLAAPFAVAATLFLADPPAFAAQTAPNGTTAPAGTAPAIDGAKDPGGSPTAAPATGAGASPAAAPSTAAPASPGIEAHVARLHKLLGITPAEEPQWNTFAAVLRSSGRDRDAAVERNKAAIPTQTAPEIMKGYADLMRQQGEGLESVSGAFATLYASLTPEQQKQADAAFRRNGTRRAERDSARR